MPPLDLRAVLAGGAAAIALTVAGLPLAGAGAGGMIAGLLARRDGAYLGAAAAAIQILAIAVLPLGGPTDAPAIFAFDAVLLAIAAVGGAAATRLSGS